MPEDNINENINPTNIPDDVDAIANEIRVDNNPLESEPVAGMSAAEIQEALNRNQQATNVNFEGVLGKEYMALPKLSKELKWTKAGDEVQVSYSQSMAEDESVMLETFENLDFVF